MVEILLRHSGPILSMTYFNILVFVISLINSKIFLFE